MTILPQTDVLTKAPMRPRPLPAGNPPLDVAALERGIAQLERIL